MSNYFQKEATRVTSKTMSSAIVKKRILNNEIITIERLLLQHFDNLTRAEKQLATTLLENYPLLGLQSITQIAKKASVSTPTVVRTAKKLGFEGFSELQRALKSEVYATVQLPMDKNDTWHHSKSEHFVTLYADAIAANMRQTLQRIDLSTFDHVATELSNPAKQLFMTGGRFTRSIADYLFNHLHIIRPNVNKMGTTANMWPQHIVDMNSNSVVLLFDIRRYERSLFKLATLAKDHGAQVILFTDQWGSPISNLANHRFNVHIETPSAWDSTMTMMFVVEALIAKVHENNLEHSDKRISELETMFNKTKIYRRFD